MTDRPVAIVTGASRGLGFETARQLGRLGYRVLMAASNTERLQTAAATLAAGGPSGGNFRDGQPIAF